MRSGRVSLIVIAAALIAAFAIPQCRRPIIEMATLAWGRGVARPQGEPALETSLERFFPDAAAMAAEHPKDWKNQLGAAESQPIETPSVNDRAYRYYREASRLQPESPVPHLRLAVALLRLVPFEGERFSDAPALSEEQRETALDHAEESLLATRPLEPDNAATDYLLAYVALARDDDPAAQQWLESALGTPGWALHQREVMLARLHVYEQSGGPDFAAIVYSYAGKGGFAPAIRIKELVKQFAARADALREAGEHEQAILWYWAGFRAGHLQASKGYDMLEALTGKACAAVAVGSFLSEEERERIVARFPGAEHGRDTEQLESLRDALDQARRRNFEAYLREHGREDLAKQHAKAAAEIGAVYERTQSYVRSDRLMVGLLALTMPMALSTEVLFAAGFVLGIWVVAGILWLILRRRVRGRQPMGWSWGTWAVLFVLSFAATAIMPFVLPPVTKETMDLWAWGPPAALGGGVVLFLLLTLAVMIVKRRRAGGEAIGGFRDFVHSLAVLLPPTVALLLVVCVATLPAADHALQRYAQQQVQKIEQGEMVYYGLRE